VITRVPVWKNWPATMISSPMRVAGAPGRWRQLVVRRRARAAKRSRQTGGGEGEKGRLGEGERGRKGTWKRDIGGRVKRQRGEQGGVGSMVKERVALRFWACAGKAGVWEKG